MSNETAGEPMTWDSISVESRQVMDDLGGFGPTIRESERMVKGYMLGTDNEGCKTYFDSADLRRIAKACIEVANWLDARAMLAAQAGKGGAS